MLRQMTSIHQDLGYGMLDPASHQGDGLSYTILITNARGNYVSGKIPELPGLETCPLQTEKLPICYKDEENDKTIQTTDAEDFDEAELTYEYLMKEYVETQALCKKAITSHVKKMCADLGASMQRLVKLHENLQDLRRQVLS